jgi:phytoene synthase
MVGQMRLAWWREALQRLDAAPPPGEPVLQNLAAAVLPLGVTGTALSDMIDGWEPLLGTLALPAVGDHARLRGRALFETAARLLAAAPGDPISAAGEGWALADLADNLSDAALAAAARDRAAAALGHIVGARWSRNARALGALALVARARLGGAVPATFVFRLARFRLTGR